MIRSEQRAERLLGTITILTAIAVVVGNVIAVHVTSVTVGGVLLGLCGLGLLVRANGGAR